MVLRRGGSIFNFYGNDAKVSEHEYFSRLPSKTPRGYGLEIIIPVDKLEKFYELFLNHHPNACVAPLAQRHSHRDFRAVDPFGFYLRFVERYNWVDGRDANGKPI